MGRPTGFEPATPRITILCSNQLSYGRRAEWKKFASPPCTVKAEFLTVKSARFIRLSRELAGENYASGSEKTSNREKTRSPGPVCLPSQDWALSS
jgi:hypothetical protein